MTIAAPLQGAIFFQAQPASGSLQREYCPARMFTASTASSAQGVSLMMPAAGGAPHDP